MRSRVTVIASWAAALMLARSAVADDRTEEARRAEAAHRAEEARRVEEHQHADMHRNAPPEPGAPHPGPHDPGARGDWKLRDLEAKERAGSHLSAEEKLALDRLKLERQKRYAELEQADTQKERSREARRLESQRLALAHYRALANDPAAHQEFQLDAQLAAQLQRARAVAQAEGRTDAIARVDELLLKEKARHDAWLAAHGER